MRGKVGKRGRSSNSVGSFCSRPAGQRTHGSSSAEIFETLRKANAKHILRRMWILTAERNCHSSGNPVFSKRRHPCDLDLEILVDSKEKIGVEINPTIRHFYSNLVEQRTHTCFCFLFSRQCLQARLPFRHCDEYSGSRQNLTYLCLFGVWKAAPPMRG
jgi:hypothetical protein